ncbi:putative sigma regulatory factor-histidine kinase [Estrella lausannensis]|uniref:Putative sigma regulatory factor-histidine kinase n=2 Tax=Estrella lausannensis TaxID=483423 RepID=A0A0H5DQI8_9BACT|nr:putative sigma regulatory factor-histidine kinase [Estrella lausannensis]
MAGCHGLGVMDKSFPATIEKLYEMLEYIRFYAIEAGFESNTIKNIELVAEEALVNVIIHGYKDTADGNVQIAVENLADPGIRIIIKDQGKPFNPHTYIVKDDVLIPKNLADDNSGVGGWGLFLIYKMMDSVEYKREGQDNVLILAKTVSSARSEPGNM